MTDQIHFLIRNLPNLLIGFPGNRPGGLFLSLLLALIAIALGFVIALIVGSGRESQRWSIRWGCALYIGTFRGLPLLLLLVLIHQVVGSYRFGFGLSPGASALIALTLYSSAYQAEVVRAGLRAVPSQQIDSARLLGGTSGQAFQHITLPYMIRIMLPAFVGESISLFKDTSVVLIIGVADLMTVARVALGGDVSNAPYWVSLYLVVGFLYFCIAFSLSRVARIWEKQNRVADLAHSLANY